MLPRKPEKGFATATSIAFLIAQVEIMTGLQDDSTTGRNSLDCLWFHTHIQVRGGRHETIDFERTRIIAAFPR